MNMKTPLAAIICISLIVICTQPSLGFQNVGEDFGSSWLEKYGTQPISTMETHNNLWNWGNAPKGFELFNGTLYPPGYQPQWYYPGAATDSTPIVINNTGSNSLQTPNYLSVDPWLMAQLSGRPVTVVKEPKSELF
jgi:hypothetical protein